MDWLDDAGDEVGPQTPQSVTVTSHALNWPVYLALAISVCGLALAAVASPLLSGIAYVVLLLAGCGLLFYRRLDAIRTTRDAGGVGTISVQRVEKATIAALSIACLSNGIVIALAVASWEVWTTLRQSLS